MNKENIKKHVNKYIKSENFKTHLIYLSFLLIAFLLIYYPHLENKYPFHVDEYFHISEAKLIKAGHLELGPRSLEIGFDFFLVLLSYFFNIVLIFRFLPFIWAFISASLLFYIIKKKTNNYFIAFFTGLFFLSIKSNSNLTGPWFFTPMIFATPLIFTYLYFFTEGIKNKNKKQIIYSMLIMLSLVLIHPISITFAIPFILIYLYMYKEYIKQEIKFFSFLLIIPLLGIIFFWRTSYESFFGSIKLLLSMIFFKYGWGINELNNGFSETYSLIGLALAIIGTYIIYIRNKKKELHLIIIPFISILSIMLYKVFKFSLFSPFQRNMYYFTIMMPILSAIGLWSIYSLTKKFKKPIKEIIQIILIILVISLTFNNYFKVPSHISLYETINDTDYKELKIIKNLEINEGENFITYRRISPAIYPITGKMPIATTFFYGNRTLITTFFNYTLDIYSDQNCTIQNKIIDENNISYVISNKKFGCNWTTIYSGKNIIYKTK